MGQHGDHSFDRSTLRSNGHRTQPLCQLDDGSSHPNVSVQWVDLFITLFFIVELAFKIILAPRKLSFIKIVLRYYINITIFRMFRLARTTRFKGCKAIQSHAWRTDAKI